jgi:heme/copper-type cytochrome/quinol oxidase subunit 3
MGEIVQYRPPRAQAEWTAYLGMVVFLASWAMMFGSLFFAYGMVRARSTDWPPPDLPTLPLFLPGINTVVLAASSAALLFVVRGLRVGRAKLVGPGLGLVALLGSVFLGLQISTWRGLYSEGLTPKGGPYASVFYALTCFHALHVLVGVIALAWLCKNALAGRYSPARYLPVRLWALYWHFVGVVWVAMFVSVYVV